MRNHHQTAALDWRDDGVPVSLQFDDPYFSISNGFAETQHVFLAGNDLPRRLQAGFHIAELGFGTGLNLLATALICPDDCPIQYTSFEAFPMEVADMARALALFAQTARYAPLLLGAWAAGARAFTLGPVQVQVIIGDAATTLPQWQGRADAWFLDGFSPAKNPALWSPQILAQVARHTAPQGSFATYSAAGHVRRALQSAGFELARVAGFGRKRHMCKGVLARAPDLSASAL